MRTLTFLSVLLFTAGCGDPSCESLGVPQVNDEYFTVELVQSGSALNVEWSPGDAKADEAWIEDDSGNVIWHIRCNEDAEGPCIETDTPTLADAPEGATNVVETASPEADTDYYLYVAQYEVQCKDQERSGVYGPFTLSSGAP